MQACAGTQRRGRTMPLHCAFRSRIMETRMAKLSAAERDALPDSAFAFPKQRKEPIPDRGHVLSAIRLFMQVEDVTEKERDEAWTRIKAAAKAFGIDMEHED